MADLRFRNIINGKAVDAADGPGVLGGGRRPGDEGC